MKQKITAVELRELYKYDPDTGNFSRNERVIGSLNPKGYMVHTIRGVAYRLHRLAWFYINGYWPEKGIDHINGIRSDNRISNLRECNQSENLQNQRKATARKHGLIGTIRRKRTRLWSSQITINKVKHHLGYFETEESAHQAYIEAKRKLHPFCQI